MPRRGQIAKRDVLPDPLYNSKLVTRLINSVMYDGKKGVAQKIVYDAFDIIKEKTGKEPLEVFQNAMENVMPVLEVKARRVGEIIQLRVERPITLACCLPKQNKFDIIVEKATELGVSRLVPLISDRTITRPSEVREHSKRERWARIIREAAEQSGRNTLPFLDRIKDLSE